MDALLGQLPGVIIVQETGGREFFQPASEEGSKPSLVSGFKNSTKEQENVQNLSKERPDFSRILKGSGLRESLFDIKRQLFE
jgi:hypothetical protein